MNPHLPITPEEQARLVMEAVAVLHARGYGLLKLYCYIKEGLGQWRHWVLASDAFPENIGLWDGVQVRGSIPGRPAFDGRTAEEVANSILANRPELLEAGRGEDGIYVRWYRNMLVAYPDGILEMESPWEASILGRGEIPLPALKAWMAPRHQPEVSNIPEKPSPFARLIALERRIKGRDSQS
ncbi:hypothetical protein [Ottowia sp.]|uniref:hypothetical protein n=1 Tax=Ottowia sp. TaxID=1898956 RepID=UPI0025D2A228|nr:hypothetical protein [Ottowia sp.]MBK6614945.1 hypothetical protein [Ottowia sp.]MBK6746026.1 hypothetical protein [Ottowia sp.]